MPQTRKAKLQLRLYRGLLYFYPADFRRTFGPSMLELFGQQLEDRMSGAGGPVWPATARDLALSVPRERLEAALHVSMMRIAGVMLALTIVVALITTGWHGTWRLIAPLIIAVIGGVAIAAIVSVSRQIAVGSEGEGTQMTLKWRLFKWLAIPIALVGFIFVFFAIAWRSAIHGGAAFGLLSVAALIWVSLDSWLPARAAKQIPRSS